jgi:hypothetical protein
MAFHILLVFRMLEHWLMVIHVSMQMAVLQPIVETIVVSLAERGIRILK